MITRTYTKFFLAGTAMLALATTAQAQFAVRALFGGDPQIDTTNEAESILDATPATPSSFTNFGVVNFVGEGGDGDFGGGVSFPGIPNNSSDFAVEALASLKVNVGGTYIFRVNSDDGFRYRYDTTATGGGGTVLSEFNDPRGPANTDVNVGTLPAGFTSNTRLTFFERGGGDELEFSYSRDGGAFALVGSTGDITATPLPEPASIVALAGGAAFLAGMRRRRS